MSSNNNTQVVGILGNGEIGSSLNRVYELAKFSDIRIRDARLGFNASLSECDFVNVCIPFFGYDEFISVIKGLGLKKGAVLLIQSTIGLGTTDKLQELLPDVVCVHSPVKGVHPRLDEGMLTFEKYCGVSDEHFSNSNVCSSVRNHILSLNIKPVICCARESELAKMLSTTLYAVNIAAVNDVSNMCEKYGLDFDTVYTKWQIGYNEGYTKLGKANVCRPVLTPTPKNDDGKRYLGGHCCGPNAVILKNMGEDAIADFVLRYVDDEGKKHVTGAKH